jgi:integrase
MVEDLRALRQINAFALGRMPEPGDRVFLSPKHRPLDPHGNPARLLLTRLLERAGIPYRDDQGRVNVDIHALRRTAGTRLARHAVPLSTVSAIMGHSDVRLTQKFYIDLRINDTKKAVEGLPEVGQPARAHPRSESAVR